MSVAAVLVAAGSGERLGHGMPKALVTLCGRPILDWAIEAFASHPELAELVIAAPAAAVETIASTVAADCPLPCSVVPGGASRTESVRRGLAALADRPEFVLVHDAARPLVPARLISDVVAALRDGADAVIPVLPVADTVKRVADEVVLATLDRAELRRVQTPQGFRASILRAAYAAAPDLVATDDAGVVEAYGTKVSTVPGDEAAFKITTPYDLRLAELLAAAR
jgi:2-C-methyl-D-erythritol 4-phosphate cytidylyltransferase